MKSTFEKQKLVESTSFTSSFKGRPRPTAAFSRRDPSIWTGMWWCCAITDTYKHYPTLHLQLAFWPATDFTTIKFYLLPQCGF